MVDFGQEAHLRTTRTAARAAASEYEAAAHCTQQQRCNGLLPCAEKPAIQRYAARMPPPPPPRPASRQCYRGGQEDEQETVHNNLARLDDAAAGAEGPKTRSKHNIFLERDKIKHNNSALVSRRKNNFSDNHTATAVPLRTLALDGTAHCYIFHLRGCHRVVGRQEELQLERSIYTGDNARRAKTRQLLPS